MNERAFQGARDEQAADPHPLVGESCRRAAVFSELGGGTRLERPGSSIVGTLLTQGEFEFAYICKRQDESAPCSHVDRLEKAGIDRRRRKLVEMGTPVFTICHETTVMVSNDS